MAKRTPVRYSRTARDKRRFRSLPLGTPKHVVVLATLIIHRNRLVGIDSLDRRGLGAGPAGGITSDRVYVCLEICVGW